MSGTTPNDDGSFSYVNLWYATQFAPFIPFPSRLYSTHMNKTSYPLAGMRFSIKDLLDLKGVLTGGGSRAMTRLYDQPLNTTAPSVQKLIDLGAICVGKTKASMFAIGEWPWNTFDIPVSFGPCAYLIFLLDIQDGANYSPIVCVESQRRGLSWPLCVFLWSCVCYCCL